MGMEDTVVNTEEADTMVAGRGLRNPSLKLKPCLCPKLRLLSDTKDTVDMVDTVEDTEGSVEDTEGSAVDTTANMNTSDSFDNTWMQGTL